MQVGKFFWKNQESKGKSEMKFNLENLYQILMCLPLFDRLIISFISFYGEQLIAKNPILSYWDIHIR